MQKYKAILELAFLILGTCLVIFVGTIIIKNVVSDGKIFNKKDSTQVVESLKEVEQPQEKDDEEFQTLKYQRAKLEEDVVKKPKSKASENQKKSNKEANSNISIEIINYSGFPKLGERFKEMFENEGFKAYARSGGSRRIDETRIIERNDNKEGILIKNIIKMGRISKVVKKNYPHNITLMIGEDVTP